MTLKLIPKRKIGTQETTENYIDHITQISVTTTNQGYKFPYRLQIPVGTDKYG